MKVDIIYLLLASLYWSASSLATELPSTQEKNIQQITSNTTNESQNDSDVSKKFFLPPIIHVDEDDNNDDDFYPKPHFPPIFYPFLHHHKPDYYDKPYPPEHHDIPKPPVYKPPHKPIHKPEHHKPPPIVIHHQPIHKPVHIHIHKPSLHAAKPPHKPAHHEEHHKPSEYSRPPGHGKPPKDDCDFNCNGTKVDDGIETIDISEAEVAYVEDDDTKYSANSDSDQSELYSQLEPNEQLIKYEVNRPDKPYNNPSNPNYQHSEDNLPGGSGIRQPIVSLSDLLSDLRPVPWYSQHQGEKAPVRKPISEWSSHLSNPEPNKYPDKDNKIPCQVHHHHHYYYPVKYPDQHHFDYPHTPHSVSEKPHNPSYHHPLAAQREDSNASSTESSLAETVDPKLTIPLNEYDVSTKAAPEEEKPEEESLSQQPTRKPKPKPSYKPISQMLLWPFTPKPARTKVTRKPQTLDHYQKKEETVDKGDDEGDSIFSDFFEIR